MAKQKREDTELERLQKRPGHIYVGRRCSERGCTIHVDGQTLNPRNDVRNHSPTGFEWSYNGSGPAQAALAILCHEYGVEFGKKYYQRFKFDVVANLARGGWRLATADIKKWRVHRRISAV